MASETAAHDVIQESDSSHSLPQDLSEKQKHDVEIEAASVDDFSDVPATKLIIPNEDDIFIDPRLKDYPIPLVA